ncbi:MAG: DegV family protein [Bacillota bacterium]|nr:DegV family protein [Bacillota bacterium]
MGKNQDYIIFADTVCELTKDEYAENSVVPMYFGLVMEGKEYKDDFGASIDTKEVYKKLREGVVLTTQQAEMQTIYNEFTEILEKGRDILYVCFSAALSGNYSTAYIVAKELKEKYPDREIYIIDSCCAAGGHGMIVRFAIELKKQGMSVKEAAATLENEKHTFCHWFIVDDLNFLHRGGRVSKTAAIMGTFIGIKPILYTNREGQLIPFDKVRGRQQALKYLTEKMKELGEDLDNQVITISHGDCINEAEYLAQMIRENCKVKDIRIDMLSPVIGSHSGPGTVALFFRGKDRV